MSRALVKRRVPMGGLGELEQRVLDGDPRAMRALLRQASGPNIIDLPFRETEIRAKPDGTGGDRLLFTGYASVYEEPFEMADWLGPFTEIVRQGAAAKTLSASPDVIFCVNHDWNAVPMARTTKADTLRVSEDSTGLPVEADLDGTRADVHQVRSAMDAGELDAMSMAFYVTRQTWSPDYDQRDILEIDLDGGDTSVVTWPANPATTGTTALRSIQAQALLRTKVPGLILARAREERKGAKLSAATLETLQAVYDLISDAGEAASAAGPLLAELLGTDSSDDDTSSETDSAAPVGMSLARLRLREDARRLSA